MNPLFLAGIILLAGSLGGALAVRCKCPRITGYLVVGMLLSPSLFNVVPEAALKPMRIFTTLGSTLFNGMLASVIVNTLLTPPLARHARWKTGECGS